MSRHRPLSVVGVGVAVAVALLLTASAATAQDLPTTQLEDHGQTVCQDMLTRSLLRQRSRGGRSSEVLGPEARATCLNKRKAAADLGANNLKVRRLYALCAKAGY